MDNNGIVPMAPFTAPPAAPLAAPPTTPLAQHCMNVKILAAMIETIIRTIETKLKKCPVFEKDLPGPLRAGAGAGAGFGACACECETGWGGGWHGDLHTRHLAPELLNLAILRLHRMLQYLDLLLEFVHLLHKLIDLIPFVVREPDLFRDLISFVVREADHFREFDVLQ